MKRIALLAAASCFAVAAAAQQYKWVDKDGKTRYGDVPPAGVKATPLKPPPSAAAPAAKGPAGKDTKELSPEAAFRKRQQEQKEREEKEAKERAEGDQKRVNCESAQANLRQLQSGARIATVNKVGEREFIDDAQRAKEIERAQKSVSDWCK